MSVSADSPQAVRAELRARLDLRSAAIERTILARAPGAPRGRDGKQPKLLREAISAGVDHGLAGIEWAGERTDPIPTALFVHARKAAHSGVTPDAMLKGYFAGYTTFGEFVVRGAADDLSLRGLALSKVLKAEAALFERLVAAVMGEYVRERRDRHSAGDRRRVELVKELLGGEAVDPAELGYELGDWHVGAIARGDPATSLLREISRVADRRLLVVSPEGETVWAWLGGRRKITTAEIVSRSRADASVDVLLAVGEPARGAQGMRLTHAQADAAFRISAPGARGIVQYADVGLLASIAQDRVLASSLHQLYLAPLSGGRDGGRALRDTLRAYFTAGRNVSSAASALRVSRQTVGNRLRAIEEKLGRTLESCAPEIELALRLDDRGDFAAPKQRPRALDWPRLDLSNP